MLFNSRIFLIFLAVVLVLYRLLPSYRLQNVMLLVASYVFYGAWNWKFLSLIAASTLIDFTVAQRIYASQNVVHRRCYLAISLTFSLGMLCFFKYFNFGIESLAAIISALGLEPHLPTLQIILPVGISFYTFQTMSYTIDVYRGSFKPVRNLLDFALFVAYFPQLVAGPIEKAAHLLPQLQKARVVTREDYEVGIMFILLGYFKKVVIADTIAPMVDHVFSHPDEVSGVVSLVGIWAFAIQIYGDFAGYTLIGRGVSRLLGIQLISNFRAPYLSLSPREFWTRWHISLSQWLRDYLYISLGGSRRSVSRTHVNLMLTMLLGGLWHGARWNFVLWGAYHGFLLFICHATGWGDKGGRPTRPAMIGLQWAATFGLTLGGWLLFRVTGLDHLAAISTNILTNFHWTPDVMSYLMPTVVMFSLLLAFHLWQEQKEDVLVLLHVNHWFRFGVYAFVMMTLLAVGFRPIPFVYFQF